MLGQRKCMERHVKSQYLLFNSCMIPLHFKTISQTTTLHLGMNRSHFISNVYTSQQAEHTNESVVLSTYPLSLPHLLQSGEVKFAEVPPLRPVGCARSTH